MDKILSSSLFSDLFWVRPGREVSHFPSSALHLAVQLPSGHRVVLTGQSDFLGAWDARFGLDLCCIGLPDWYLDISDLAMRDGLQYKFVIMDGDSVVGWESGENRVWNGDLECGEFRGAPTYRPRFAGTAIPLFSIRGSGCEGIGDFLSLGEFARWVSLTGQRVVQILPINDTTDTHTWADSYPYKSISTFALHPLYIRVSELISGSLDVYPELAVLAQLDKLDAVDYDSVDAQKWVLFRRLYATLGEQCLASDDFRIFFATNELWLRPYAIFSHLRDRFSTADFSQWEAPYNIYSVSMADRVEFQSDLGLYYFLQFHADRQLRIARNVARSVGVVLKGDIPIGVSRGSVETWVEPHLFNMAGQAGAPPDDFSIDGQNWGFPTYNWDVMASDGYLWWRRRFEKMADYFDLYRIDHILGFFRIWEIPVPQRSGLMGHFSPALPFTSDELAGWGLPMCEERYLGVNDADPNTLFVRDHHHPSQFHPRIAAHQTERYRSLIDDYEREHFDAIYTHYFYHRHNDFWAAGAMRKLPALIGSTSMLCCAEDLGMIPDCVASTLSELEIITLEIQRMPKESGQLFGNPASYPYPSVCTTSSHDISPLRLWWQENPEQTTQYYNTVLGLPGTAPASATPQICEQIIVQHLNAPSIAAILPLSDWLSVDPTLRAVDPASERINIPGNANHYWQYRTHLTVEQLLDASQFNTHLHSLITQTHRVI